MKPVLTLCLYCCTFCGSLLLFYSFITHNSHLEAERVVERTSFWDDEEGKEDALSLQWWNFGLGRHSITQGCPKIPNSFQKYIPPVHSDPLTERERVLALCKQTEPISLDSFFTETMKWTVTKIGDGVFADVYGCQKEGWDKLAIRIVPIESNTPYKLQKTQSTFKSIQTEIVVSLELSLLGDEARKYNKSILHYTRNFMQFERIALCTGKYPKFLSDAWEDYDFRKKSHANTRPDIMFSEDQLYILYSTEYAGYQFGSYIYHSFQEFLSIMQQVSVSLAVAEMALQFEHRDLHRGNVLVRRTDQEYIHFRLDGVEYSIKSYGAMATIVDYTFSRITQEGTNCTSYYDLNETSFLFNGTGSQAEVYATMLHITEGDWKGFYPRSNVLWLNYLATKAWQSNVLSNPDWHIKLKPYVLRILENRSAKEVFLNIFSPEAMESTKRKTAKNTSHTAL